MDGATERVNRSIEQMFWALIKPDQRNWVEKSPLIKFAINASIGNAMGFTSFKRNYGYMPTMVKEMRAMERTPQGVDNYLMLSNVKKWRDLPKRVMMTSQRSSNQNVKNQGTGSN